MALLSRGITCDPRNVPWALHAIRGKGQAAAAQVSRNDAAWDERLEELRLFAQGNGGLANVSQRDPERPGLGRWCDWQRTLEVKGKLREDREVLLLEIGFVFDLYEAAWDQSFEELRVFSEGNGGVAHVSRTDPERRELAVWCHNQRVRVGELRADRKARLLEIGFDFDFLEATWEQSFEELRLIAEGNGGAAHVSTYDPQRSELGIWCVTQRQLEKSAKLRADRKARLLEIGFDFKLLETAREQSVEKRRLAAEASHKPSEVDHIEDVI